MWEKKQLRRRDRAVEKEAAMALLEGGEWGVLATANGEGVPLATPLSYVVLDGAIYFHSAAKGHKLENIAAQPRVCFCVVGATQPVYDGDFSTIYESVMVHGAATLAEGEEKRRALAALCHKYMPQHDDKVEAALHRAADITAVVRISMDEVSGKAKKAK